MDNRKRAILAILFTFSLSFVNADEQKLHIILKSGNYISIPIIDKPKIMFDDGIMYVGNDNLLAGNVAKYIIGTEEVLDVNGSFDRKLQIDASNASEGKVTMVNFCNEAVRLYSPSGIVMPVEVKRNDNTASIDFSSLPAGVYILCIGKEELKIQKQ